jgi:D-3-phosphoglycerate dehydrogenase / 2-oxoglutarate reductase
MARILVADFFDFECYNNLKAVPGFEVHRIDRGDLQSYPHKSAIDGIFIRTHHKITQKTIDNFSNLKLIVVGASGADNVDTEYAKEKGISVVPILDANTNSTAELTVLLMLAIVRNFNSAQVIAKRGKWDSKDLMGCELLGETLGLIGFGRIGQRVAEILGPFGLNISAFDPGHSAEDMKKFNVTKVDDVDDILEKSRIISLHLNYSEENHYFLGEENLLKMRVDSFLINTSRGKLIDENALVEVLQSGYIAGCGLDVFESEPLPITSELLKIPNVIISPHIGGLTKNASRRISELSVEKFKEHFILNKDH